MIDQKVLVGWEDIPAVPGSGGTEGSSGQMAYDVTRNPVWRAGRNTIEDQYGVARENVLANIPKGGALTDALTNTEIGRADMLTNLTGNVSQDEYNKLYGMATGAPQTSIGGLSSLAGSQAMANAQTQAGKYGATGDFGQGLGQIAAAAILK